MDKGVLKSCKTVLLKFTPPPFQLKILDIIALHIIKMLAVSTESYLKAKSRILGDP